MIIYTDGGSRGNPGLAACAVVFLQEEKVFFQEGYFLGTVTNNVAEYQGLIKALTQLTSQTLVNQTIIINMDSELVVKQMNGQYAIRDTNLKDLAMLAQKLIKENERKNKIKIIIKHIKRSENKLADTLVNFTLDHVRPDSATNHT